MAWVAVDKDGNEAIFAFKPVMNGKYWHDWQITIEMETFDSLIPLPKGSIKKLIGKDLTWEDNPIELKEE